ncbi:BadF/BadG/BcrA/BcrD ATPase family protein [Paenibacillus sp. MB22_1]|uniref:BadF/BadG/BcrA/BcrD ATPase family protein n=1 Tax=Paenibacillus TaxID=44249 RepID=UPI0021A4B3B8|nr:BadF/BadG/BcrA/BcrD ATPase family protein [Paenibacillus sp. p3-SID1389]MCT2195439.1 ATPase [Paenibacillus sp. p3-SID1389]
MRYVVGIDGGGTKTKATVADETGNVVRSFAVGPLNLNGQDAGSVEQTLDHLLRIVAEVCGGLEHCVQMCLGAAGISNPVAAERLTSLIRSGGYRGGLDLVGDHETALCGALDRSHGLILIAGTGSICFGRNARGETHRTGGCGHLIDDEGSGYSIGRELLSAVVRAADGRSGPTAITELVYAQLEIDSVRQLIGFVYSKDTNKKDIAALAPLLSPACELGDSTALAIARRSAIALAEMAAPVASRLALEEGELALAGSVLLRSAHVQAGVREALNERFPRLTCTLPKHDAAYGAVMLALRALAPGRG